MLWSIVLRSIRSNRKCLSASKQALWNPALLRTSSQLWQTSQTQRKRRKKKEIIEIVKGDKEENQEKFEEHVEEEGVTSGKAQEEGADAAEHVKEKELSEAYDKVAQATAPTIEKINQEAETVGEHVAEKEQEQIDEGEDSGDEDSGDEDSGDEDSGDEDSGDEEDGEGTYVSFGHLCGTVYDAETEEERIVKCKSTGDDNLPDLICAQVSFDSESYVIGAEKSHAEDVARRCIYKHSKDNEYMCVNSDECASMSCDKDISSESKYGTCSAPTTDEGVNEDTVVTDERPLLKEGEGASVDFLREDDEEDSGDDDEDSGDDDEDSGDDDEDSGDDDEDSGDDDEDSGDDDEGSDDRDDDDSEY